MFFLFLIPYFLINFFLIGRMLAAMRGLHPAVRYVCGGIALIFLTSSLAIRLLHFRGVEDDGTMIRLLAFAGSFWIAFILHGFLFLLAFDIFRYFNRKKHWIVIQNDRKALWRHAVCFSIIFAALSFSVLGWINTQYPTLRHVTIPAPPGSPPLKIAALSDTHLGRIVSPQDFSRLIDLIEPQNPDLVLFLGDILDDYPGLDIPETRKALERLNPPLGIWGVLGNHEYIAGDAKSSLRFLDGIGIRILRDDWVSLDDKILLLGRDDRSKERFEGSPRKPLNAILETIPQALRQKPVILMDHQPHQLEEAEQAGALLQLSGHTHNGQLFPFNFLVAYMYENAHGHSQRGDTHYWVTSGAGTWGPRVRTTGRPEVLFIQLSPALP